MPQADPDGLSAALSLLGERFGERLSTNHSLLQGHSGEGVFSEACLPDAVVFAECTEDVQAVSRICHDHRVPMIPYGAGTSLEGQLQAVQGGVSIDLSRMNRVLEVNVEDLDCRVEAGVMREDLNVHLRDLGLFFPLDPGANATLAGMAATRASGTNAVRYGTMRDVTLGLTLVTPDGRVMKTGSRARKSSTGYDLTRLLVGSEGTLGTITEVQLRLFGIPETIVSAVCPFETLDGAVSAVTAILQYGVPVARIELLDALQMKACIGYSKLDEMKPVDTLFLEFHGSEASVADQVRTVEAVFADFGCTGMEWADTTQARSRLWKARHDAYWAGRSLVPGAEAVPTDACVPISRLPDAITECRAEADRRGIIA
ncbi:MAG: FAD-binding protein, partial [Pseudomonadota bacterium]